tara:strand:+ start:1220 stop:1546 length:327 start_codon:yes stop_codon:yes gene_type:complete
MSLSIKIPNEDYIKIEPSQNIGYGSSDSSSDLGDFFEISDYQILLSHLASVFIYDRYKKQSILLTPIERIDSLFLIVKDEYILTNLMIFMAIYNENKLKWASGGKDLD